MSGQGMMDCKKAIGEAKGNLDEAMAILRKKGLATLAKRAERDTKEGKVICQINGEGKIVAMATLVLRNGFCRQQRRLQSGGGSSWAIMLWHVQATAAQTNLMDTFLNGKKFSQIVTDTVSKTGEKMQVVRLCPLCTWRRRPYRHLYSLQ